MKLMNRTSLVAVATSVALTSGALAAPAMAQSSAASDTTVSTVDPAADTTGTSTSSNIVSFVDTLATSSKQITDSDAYKWFTVAAAVLSVVAAGITFALRIQSLI